MSPSRPRGPGGKQGDDENAKTTVERVPTRAEPITGGPVLVDPFSRKRDPAEDSWGAEIDAWGATLGEVVPEMRTPTPPPLVAPGSPRAASPGSPSAPSAASPVAAAPSRPGTPGPQPRPGMPSLAEELALDLADDGEDEALPPLPLGALPDAAPDGWRDPVAWLGWQGTFDEGATGGTGPLSDAELTELVAEERLESPVGGGSTGSELAQERARALGLALSAYRLAERAGDRVGARRFLDEALAVDDGSPAALRARLLGSELAAERGDASAEVGLAWLKRLGASGAEDAVYYRTLAGEWALALAAEGVPAEANAGLRDPADAFPAGLARSFGRVEWAQLQSRPDRAARELETGAGLPPGALRAALGALAARLHEVSGKLRDAAEVRARASAADPSGSLCAAGVLRDAARLEGLASLALLNGAVHAWGPTALAASVARWTAGVFVHAADGEGARAVLEAAARAGATSPTLLRDRFDLAVGGSVATMQALAHEAARAWPELGAWPLSLLLASTARFDRRLVDPRIAPGPGQLDDDVRAVQAWLDEAVAAAPGEKVLALVAERAAEAPSDLETRLKLFRTWATLDPSRSAPAWAAASSLSREARRPEEVTSALRPLVEQDPGHPGFWWLSEQDAASGRPEEAAARFEAAAAAWAASPLAAWLRERAAEWRAVRDPAGALDVLARLAREARGAEARGVRATWLRVLRAAPDAAMALALRSGDLEIAADGDEQANLWSRLAVATGSADALQSALAARVADPQALALLMTAERDAPERIADEIAVLTREAEGEVSLVFGLLGATFRIMAGEEERAREEIRALIQHPGVGLRPAVAASLRRTARAVGPADVRARLLYASYGSQEDPASVDGDGATSALELAEAMATLEEPAAEPLLRRLAFGPAGPEARLAFLRLVGNLTDLETLWSVDARTGFSARLGLLGRDIPGASLEEGARLVLASPPHETTAGLSTQTWAWSALPPAEAAAPLATCLADADARKRPAFPLRWRALSDASDLAARASLLGSFGEALVDRPRAAAALWVEAGGLLERLEQREAARRAYGEARRLDARSFSALTGLRRLAVSSGDLPGAATLAEQEDLLLAATRARVRVLLASARLVAAAEREEASLALLQRAFSLAPEDAEVFTRLGDRLQALGRARELAELLGERLMVTRNPFEMTSLRLRRAELLAEALGERGEAKLELGAVLQKEPDHARALVDLAGLLEQEGSFGEAAELLVRRTLNERDGERLAALFLRLGNIYRSHLNDDRRALGAFLKVIQIDPRHQESLAAAVELHARLGDPRSAVPLAERLLALGLAREDERRWRIRLGQLQEQSQDLRQAAINLRRAWDQPPANLTALRELARFLERTRDERGRRVLLEDAQVRLLGEALDPEGDAAAKALAASEMPDGVEEEEAAGARLGQVWRALRDVASQRGLTLANRFATQMAATLDSEGSSAAGSAEGHAPLDGRGLLARLLRDPEAEDKLYRALAPPVTSGLRALLRALAPHLAQDRKLDLKARGLTREERQTRGTLREIVLGFAHEAGVSDLEIFVKAWPTPTEVVPGAPSALVMGAPLAVLGGPSTYFVGARTAYLVGSGTAFLLADEADEGALFLAGLVRCFVPSFVHPSFTETAIEQRAQQLARSIPKKRKAELAAFAWESAGPFDFTALREGAVAVANVVGLLGCGHLPSALAVLVTEQNVSGGQTAVRRVKEARSLASFALSSDLDDLWRGWA